MTNSDFQSLFDDVYHSLPDYADESICCYLERGIRSDILISDEAADKAQEQSNVPVPAASLVASETHWHYVFRPFLIESAPENVIRTIVRHEMIEGFLISVEHSGVKAAIEAAEKYKSVLLQIAKECGVEVAKDYNVTEDLVCFINDQWGGDEKCAKIWVSEYLRKMSNIET